MLTFDAVDRLIRTSVDKLKPYLDHTDYERNGIDEIFEKGNGVPANYFVEKTNPVQTTAEDYLFWKSGNGMQPQPHHCNEGSEGSSRPWTKKGG